tara:strand:+ start:217 stop:456 length:240 start_codon:yes stop_codon:yes gene_type:complete
MRIATGIIIIATGIIIMINFFTGYASAFEADQACNALLLKENLNKNIIGCDHDLETRQWILFEKQDELEAAKVLQRFKY